MPTKAEPLSLHTFEVGMKSTHLILQFGGGAALLVHVEVLPLLELLLAVRTRDRGGAGRLQLGLGRLRFPPPLVLVLPVSDERLLVPAIVISDIYQSFYHSNLFNRRSTIMAT